MYQENPLSPHLQIYGWQISSLLSITHRIIGVVNIFAITLICFWTVFLLFGEQSYCCIFNFNSSDLFIREKSYLACILLLKIGC